MWDWFGAGPAWFPGESEPVLAVPPAGARVEQRSEDLQLQHHEREQNGELHPGSSGNHGSQQREVHEER